jgi:peptidoglycan/xylan/chitin deacetylase (PgdA/CDA1 family)
MSWDQIRELQAAGVTIGSQTSTHPHMHQISIEQSKSEIAESNARFIAELGLRPNLFAYPYGE